MDFLMNMPIVTTALSLMIAWALFAILCSMVSEAIARVMAERGRFMRSHLLKQLYDHPNGINWARMLYVHGTIDLLSRSSNKPTSDIAPHLFAETMIEIVGKAQITQMRISDINPETWAELKETYKSPLLRNFKAATMVLQPSDVMTFLKQAMMSAEICGAGDEAKTYDALVLQIKTWYEQMTQRMSVWYGKKTRQRLFYLGVVIGLIVNVDSVQLFQHFNENPKAREAMMNYYEQNVVYLEGLAARLDSAQAEEIKDTLVLAAATAPDSATQAKLESVKTKLTADYQKLSDTRDSIQKYLGSLDSLAKEAQLPVGWDHSLLKAWFCPGKMTPDAAKAISGDTTSAGQPATGATEVTTVKASVEEKKELSIIWRIIGILITGAAASLGAPFWFQVLKKVYPTKTSTSQQANK